MKIPIWLLTFQLMAICFVSWVLSFLLVRSGMHDLGMPLPAITKLALFPNTWILLYPAPWLIYAVTLSCRHALNPKKTLIFQISIAVATILLLCVVVAACALPFMALDYPLSEPANEVPGGGD